MAARWATAGRRAGTDNAKDFRFDSAPRRVSRRDDFANYVPLPFIFPLLQGISVTVQFTYIPGTYNNGNVLFVGCASVFKG